MKNRGSGTKIGADNFIHIGNGAEPKDLDPHICTGVPEFHIIMNIFEGLVGKDPRTLDPIPGVAEKWEVSQDGLHYTFHLRKNAKWSNGDPVTAQDFVYSWIRLLKPETAAEYAYQGYYFKNGKLFNEGKLKDTSQLGFKAVDDYTIQANLENPTPFFLSLLYHHSLYPVHQKTIEKFGQRWTRPENMVTNGAFALDRWEMNKIISIKKNPNYWDKDTVKLAGAHYYPTENLDTEEKMFRRGELHITNEVPLEKILTWQADKTGVYQTGPYLGNYFYWINVTKPPLDNKLVRRALNLGFDRTKIVKFVTRGGQAPAQFFTPPGTGNFMPKSALPADLSLVAEAKKLLAQAGYPEGKGLPPIEILYNSHPGHKKIAEALQEMWKSNLGVEIKLFNQEWKVYLDTMRTKNYQLGRQGWIGDYNDPNTFLDMLMSDNGNNRSGWASQAYDAVMAKAQKERNLNKRLVYFQQAEELIMEDLPVIPIYIYTRTFLKHAAVQGWYPNIEDIHPLKNVSLAATTLAKAD
ncbi:MAG: peptide ABC transporter substrate-binding protein [Deltaproteobacteria bacterium]|nr:peptide ABC transporter substrate-binding protein [Deltaproteobacteria bacterium]